MKRNNARILDSITDSQAGFEPMKPSGVVVGENSRHRLMRPPKDLRSRTSTAQCLRAQEERQAGHATEPMQDQVTIQI
jgi:hypothetical protein